MTAVLVLVLLLVATAVTCGPFRRPGWLLTVTALALLWLVVNQPIEGPVLWVVLPGHGLTVADLLSPVCVVASAVSVWLYRRRRVREPVPAGSK